MKYSYLLPALLLIGFTACQRESAFDENGNGDTKDVTTQFVLSIATSAPQTKMSAANVQQGTDFLGIQDAVLLTYSTGITGGAPYVNSSADPAAGTAKKFDLETLYPVGSIEVANNKESSSSRMIQLSLPVNTDAVLFYGKAIKQLSDKMQGATSDSIYVNPSKTVFAAKKIFDSQETVDKYDATARLMIFAINQIFGAEVIAQSTSESLDGYTGLPALKWADLGKQYEINHGVGGGRFSGTVAELSPLEESLGKAWSTATYIKPGEYRAGSSYAIKQMVSDMYSVIYAGSILPSPSNAKEANAKRLCQTILEIAGLYFNSSFTYLPVTGTSGEENIHDNLKDKGMTDAEWTDPDTGFALAQDLNSYPYGDFGIPEGAAQLAYNNATLQFRYLHPNKPLVNYTVEEFEPRKYVYPAELFYYVNSPIRVSSKDDLGVADFPNGVTPWNTEANWGSWTFPGKVASTTRGVAVKDNINYGVALLKTSVQFTEAAVTNGLKDNRQAMTGEADKVIPTASSSLVLRGILVGGVNPRMNWQFTRKYTSAGKPSATVDLSNFDGVIYDTQVVSSSIPTASDTYTLVYDNYNSSIPDDQSQSDVFIALEFENHGDDFWGRDNLIRNGAVFYLVAKISPAAYNATDNPGGTSTSITWPADHQIPPLYGVDGEAVPAGKVAGQSKQIPRVFIQDFMTRATFRLGEESLKKAYYTVPDLRSSTMSLGLSVDLEWNNGFTYDVVL